MNDEGLADRRERGLSRKGFTDTLGVIKAGESIR